MIPATTQPVELVTLAALGAAAVHEAAHHVARVALGVPAGALYLSGHGGGRSNPDSGGQEPRATDCAVVALAGVVAEGQYRGGVPIRELEVDVEDAAAFSDYLPDVEYDTLGLVRTHWAAILRLARVLLESPGAALTPTEALAAIGPDVVGVRSDPDILCHARAQISGGAIDSVLGLDDQAPAMVFADPQPHHTVRA